MDFTRQRFPAIAVADKVGLLHARKLWTASRKANCEHAFELSLRAVTRNAAPRTRGEAGLSNPVRLIPNPSQSCARSSGAGKGIVYNARTTRAAT